MKKPYFTVHDKAPDTYFTAVIFPEASAVVAFPADTKNLALSSWAAPDRWKRICARAGEKGTKLEDRKWRYYEVSPYPELLMVRKFEVKAATKLLGGKTRWENDPLAEEKDFKALDLLSQEAGVPTIREYYNQICEDRKATGSLEKTAHEMISSWTDAWPSTEKLLAQLKFDELNRMYLVNHYKHGWYYTVTCGERKEFFRTENTESLLRSFIVHAEEAEKKGEKIRFAYCLREYMPEGIEWQESPCLREN